MSSHPATAKAAAVYVAAGKLGHTTPMILLSSQLEPADQAAAVEQMIEAHRQHVPLEELVRATVRGSTCAEVAAALGVAEAAVRHRVRHLDPWEAARVRGLKLADAG